MATAWQGSPRERRALDAFIKLVRAGEAVVGLLAPGLAAAGLSVGQFGVLELLFHRGPQLAGEIARRILRSGGSVTSVVDHLERRGLVRRVRGEQDRRQVRVGLTAAGAALVRRLLPGHVAAIVRQFAVLAAAEQDELGRLCKKVGVQP